MRRKSSQFDGRYYVETSPLREALSVVCGGAEPPEFVQGCRFDALTDAQKMELQDWCSVHCKPSWATGIGALEAAEHIVNCAIENANIVDPEAES